jgi:hypothetical protein
MDKTSGRNFVIRFFPKSLAIGQKSSKTVIALEGMPISAYPFRLLLLSLGPTYGQDITSKAIYKLVNLPRQSKTEDSSVQIIIICQYIFYRVKFLSLWKYPL